MTSPPLPVTLCHLAVRRRLAWPPTAFFKSARNDRRDRWMAHGTLAYSYGSYGDQDGSVLLFRRQSIESLHRLDDQTIVLGSNPKKASTKDPSQPRCFEASRSTSGRRTAKGIVKGPKSAAALRTSVSDTEVKRMAEYVCAKTHAWDETHAVRS